MDETTLHTIRGQLSALNKMIMPYQFAYVEVSECQLLKKNARYMTKHEFNQLTENIKRDGFLSQIPFAIRVKNKYKILSGNHRIKAAQKAGLKYVMIQYIDNANIDKQKGIQLSHNALIGQDDISILKEIYDSIQSLDLKQYSGIDEKMLYEFESMQLQSINEADIEFNEIKFFFNEKVFSLFEKVIKKLNAMNIERDTARFVFVDYLKFIEVMTEIKKYRTLKMTR